MSLLSQARKSNIKQLHICGLQLYYELLSVEANTTTKLFGTTIIIMIIIIIIIIIIIFIIIIIIIHNT